MRSPRGTSQWWPWVLAALVLCVGCGLTEWRAREDIDHRQADARAQAEILGAQVSDRLVANAVPAYFTTHLLEVIVVG